MINEKEIRIGNLYATNRNNEVMVKGVDTENKVVIINPVVPDMEITTRNANSAILEDLYPIELSETKLMQYGFTSETKVFVNIVSNNGARFQWDAETKQLDLIDCNDGIIGQSIRYLHQFQNIYFYITGKELALI